MQAYFGLNTKPYPAPALKKKKDSRCNMFRMSINKYIQYAHSIGNIKSCSRFLCKYVVSGRKCKVAFGIHPLVVLKCCSEKGRLWV